MTAPLTRELRLPRLRAEVRLEPASLDAEARTVDLLVYSGATVDRFPAFDQPYRLTLALGAKNVRLGRLESGAPLKAGHAGDNDLSAVVGVVAQPRLSKEGLRARARFSRRPEVEGLFQDVRDGVIRNVSMEAILHAVEDVTKDDDREKHLLATDWEVAAVALIGVPADPGAQALEADGLNLCTFTRAAGASEKLNMDTDISTTDDLDDDDQPKTRAQLKAENAELKRQAEAHRIAKHFTCGDVAAQRWINEGMNREEMYALAAEDRAKRSPRTRNDIGFGTDYDSGPALHDRMAEGLAAQIRGVEPSEMGRPFCQLGFTGTGRELLRRQRRDTFLPSGRSGDSTAIELSLSTSDFPSILAGTANKTLLPAYAAAPVTYRQLCARQDFRDFRQHSFVQSGDFPAPLAVGEGGEIKFGYFGERKETGVLGTFGRRLSFTRQMLVNDDLNAFQRTMNSWGQRLADFENGLFFALLTSGGGVGPTMSDTGALYNATALTTLGGHANYTASGTAISDTSMNVGAALMMAQTGGGSDGLGDGIKLNIQPRYLLAPPSKRQLAIQYTSANYTPAAATSINTFAGVIVPLLDSNLAGNRWYMFGSPDALASFTYGGLEGDAGPRVATRAGWEIEGLEMKIAFDIAFVCVDWRSTYANVGA